MAKKAVKTLITFLLDKSGSMQSIKDDTIGAFNGYLDGLKADKADIDFTLVQFDSIGLEKTYVREPIAKVDGLNASNYQPRASTPLIDASYKTIKAVEKALGDDTKTKVVICIQTDGHENCSTQHTWADLNALIKEKTKLGWQFNFMGAGIDAYDQGAKMGLSATQTMSYNSLDPVATHAAFAARGMSHSNFASGVSASTTISTSEKLAAGDMFDPIITGKVGVNPTHQRTSATVKQKDMVSIVDDLEL